MKEFAYLNSGLEVVIPDEIEELKAPNDEHYLVSNSPNLKAEIYAPEIDFYLKNSKDNILQKAKNLNILYEARANVFDLAKDMDYEKKVGKNVILISDKERTNLSEILKQNGYKVINLTHAEVKFLYGEIGDLYTTVLSANDEFEVKSDFVLVDGIKEYMLRQSGTLDISILTDEEILKYLDEKTPIYHYKSAITYDDKICQYRKRRSEHCTKCVDICPTVAILKDDEKKELVFSHIDCVRCGGCVSVCPSGAIDYAKMPSEAFYDMALKFKDKKIVITPRIMDLETCDVVLDEGVLPFAVEGEKFLSQTHFMTLLQESGANLIFFSDVIAPGVKESIDLVNQIIKAKFNEVGILVAKDEIELRKQLKELKFIDGLKFNMNERTLSKREIFSKRVLHIVDDDDLGVAKSGECVRYGKVSIDENTCTLCLSCVGACNVAALIADESDNSIKFNASLCTTCGYCIQSCAEKDTIFLKRGEMELKKEYFEYQTLAKDELFKCIECEKEFATTKAVLKIANMMTPLFGGDTDRIKTLYCCADCKAKIMIQKQIKEAKETQDEILKESK